MAIFYSILKQTVVTVIYKSGDKINPTNYSPNSLTNNVTKIVQKWIEHRKVLKSTRSLVKSIPHFE